MEEKSTRSGPAGLFLLLFLLLMARNCACGIAYYPQLDDYIQYHNYAFTYSFPALQQATGLLASRPLAGIADYFFWSPMFGHMILGVALISALHVLAALLVWKILMRYFRLSVLFPVLVTLLPLGIEGTYWMSASTRVVVGAFFAALATWTFLKWLDRGGLGRLALYVLIQVFPFGFYEQAGILSVTLTVGAAILERTLNKKDLWRCAVSLWGVPAVGLCFLFTRIMSNGGAYGSRSSILLPFNHYYWREFFPGVMGQFRDVFFKGNFLILVKGFVRGARMILSGRLVLWALAVLVLCALFGLFAHRWAVDGGRGKNWLALLAGLLLAAGPVSLFLFLENPWFSMRGAVTSFWGMALIADTALLWLLDKLSIRRNAILAAAAAFVFCVAGASEISDYRDTYETDQRVARLVLDAFAEDGINQDSGRIGILNLEASYLPNQNYFYHEHIHGCTESSWAFVGLLTAADGKKPPSVTPLPSDPMYRQWNRETNHPSGFSLLYWYDGTDLIPAELEDLPGGSHLVKDREGRVLGRIWEENGTGYIRPPEQKIPPE